MFPALATVTDQIDVAANERTLDVQLRALEFSGKGVTEDVSADEMIGTFATAIAEFNRADFVGLYQSMQSFNEIPLQADWLRAQGDTLTQDNRLLMYIADNFDNIVSRFAVELYDAFDGGCIGWCGQVLGDRAVTLAYLQMPFTIDPQIEKIRKAYPSGVMFFSTAAVLSEFSSQLQYVLREDNLI